MLKRKFLRSLKVFKSGDVSLFSKAIFGSKPSKTNHKTFFILIYIFSINFFDSTEVALNLNELYLSKQMKIDIIRNI